MSIDHRLRNPTLVPETHDHDSRNFPITEPSYKLREDNNTQSPSISYQSSRSSTAVKPTYHSIIEEHTPILEESIRPFVKQIVKEDKRCINTFSLISSIGHGQFGKVYKAQSQADKSVVAIKMISKKPWNNQQYSMNQTMRQIQLWKSRGLSQSLTGDEAIKIMNVQKCRWEIYVLGRLSSPYVVLLKECLDSSMSKSIWIVNEWCNLGELKWKRRNGETALSQWEQFLPGCNNLSFAERVLKDLTHGLLYLKSQGCIHRDIKPSNILVDGNQNLLKISDFGCAVLIPEVLPFNDELFQNSFKAELNKIVGTPAFIAPELCQFADHTTDNIDDGFKLDIWSLGVTIFSMLYNEMPFYGENEFDTYQKVTTVSLLSKMDGQFLNDLIIGKVLDKDPKTRVDVEELAEIILPKRYKDNSEVAPVKETVKYNKGKKSVQKFFDKIWNVKKNKKKAGIQPSNNESVIEPTDPSVRSSHFSDFPIHPRDSSSSSSSYEEPVQVTEFIEPGRISLGKQVHKDSEENYSSSNYPNSNVNANQASQNSGAEIAESVSILSISPIKIPTPIKALIRIKNSPKSKKTISKTCNSSPLKEKNRKKSEGPTLAHSNDIINFQKYIHPNAQDDKKAKNKTVISTTEDIQEYLKYADDL